jgi:hypothetical protein
MIAHLLLTAKQRNVVAKLRDGRPSEAVNAGSLFFVDPPPLNSGNMLGKMP